MQYGGGSRQITLTWWLLLLLLMMMMMIVLHFPKQSHTHNIQLKLSTNGKTRIEIFKILVQSKSFPPKTATRHREQHRGEGEAATMEKKSNG